jgi:hypothetical protein
MSRKILCAIVFALAVVGSASAATVTNCLNCNYTQMYNKAVSKGTGSWQIYNLANGEIHKWVVTCGIQQRPVGGLELSANGGGQTETACTGQEGNVTQEYQDTASHLAAWWGLTAHSMSATLDVHADHWNFLGYGPGHDPSAYDYILDANLRAQLNDKLDVDGLANADGSSLLNHAEYFLAHAEATLGFTSGLLMKLNVIFDDGSHLLVTLSLENGVSFIQGSGRDVNGQLIPDANTQNYQGNWHYVSGDTYNRDKMWSVMHGLGYIIVSPPPQFYNIVCTWHAGVAGQSDSSLSCTVSVQ